MRVEDLIELLKRLKGKKLVDVVLSGDKDPDKVWGLIFSDRGINRRKTGFKYYPETKILELCDFGIVR